MRKLKLVQVGLGFWGQDWAEEILPKAAEVEVVGYVDPAPEALAALRQRLGMPRVGRRRSGSGRPGLASLPFTLRSGWRPGAQRQLVAAIDLTLPGPLYRCAALNASSPAEPGHSSASPSRLSGVSTVPRCSCRSRESGSM